MLRNLIFVPSRAGNAGVEGRDGPAEGANQSWGVQGTGRPGAARAAQHVLLLHLLQLLVSFQTYIASLV